MNEIAILDKRDTNFMRTIAIISIILHHLSLQYESIMILKPFKYLGFLMVGIFFFLSGYGLYVSMKSKENYLKKIPRKIVELIISFGIAWVIYSIFYKILGIEIKNVFFVVKNIWYLYELILFYIIFYVFFKCFKENVACICIFTSILLVLFMAYFVGLAETWYKSSILFIFGIFIARNKEKFKKLLFNKFLFIGELIILCILLVIGQKTQMGFCDIILYNLATILYVITFIKLYYYIKLYKISRFKISQIIGVISLEIYLYHGLIIQLVDMISDYIYVNVIIVLIISIIWAYLIWIGKKWIKNFKK